MVGGHGGLRAPIGIVATRGRELVRGARIARGSTRITAHALEKEVRDYIKGKGTPIGKNAIL